MDLTQLPPPSVSPLDPPGSDNGEMLDLRTGDLGSGLRYAPHGLKGPGQLVCHLNLMKLPHL